MSNEQLRDKQRLLLQSATPRIGLDEAIDALLDRSSQSADLWRQHQLRRSAF